MKERTHNKYFIFDVPRKYGTVFFIKYVLAYIFNIACHLILYWGKNTEPSKVYKYKLSICAIFKNEAPFMREWIVYHQLLGVEHFYLYNNFSTDNYIEIIQSFIDDGVVTLIEWPIPQGQMEAYRHWYNTYRNDSQWVSFLDLDEFVCPYFETNLNDWLMNYISYPVVAVYWKMFGTSGMMKHDSNRLVTEQYIVSWDRMDNIGKLFYQTKYDIAFFSKGMMHAFSTKVRLLSHTFYLPPVNEFKCFYNPYGIHFVRGEFSIQINHYWSKAYGSYLEKHKRGDAVFRKSPRDMEYFLFHENNNRSTDYKIYRFLIKLKMNCEL